MKKVIAQSKVMYLQILDELGRVDKLLEPKISKGILRQMYDNMIYARVLDEIGLSMQREGRIGTFAECLGEEAAIIGATTALRQTDWLVPSYREQAAFIVRSIPLRNIFLNWMGSELGFSKLNEYRTLPFAIPVGTQPLHAVGISWAMKLKKEKCAALTFFGDGATSTGDCHEAFNFAGVYKTPTVFLCRNNQFAISLPRSKQCAAETLAQKAVAYGFEGVQVDGNDILAVFSATKDALQKAYQSKGPTLIEAITCRRGPHTTADDPKRYVAKDFTAKCSMLDPLQRFERYLLKKKIINEHEREHVWGRAQTEVKKAAKEAEEASKQNPEDMFSYVYKEFPPHFNAQLDEAKHETDND